MKTWMAEIFFWKTVKTLLPEKFSAIEEDKYE